MASIQRQRRDSSLAALRQEVTAARERGLDRLPAERQLAEDLQVSRGLVRSLLGELAKEGLVQAMPQSGWLLTGQALSEPNNALIGFSQMGRLYGYEPQSEVLESSVRLVHESEAPRLRVPPMSRVWTLRRLRRLDALPVSVEQVVLPLDLVGHLPTRDMTNRSLLADLEAIGVLVTRTDVTIEAQVAGPSLALFLQLDSGAPVLTQREIAYDQFGREVFLGHADYRSDSYRFRSTLTRRT